MGGSSINRDLLQEEKGIVTFVLYGPLTGGQRTAFNDELKKLLDQNNAELTRWEIDEKAPGDP